jgi:hypothetical protein
MSRNGSGVYTFPSSELAPAVSGQTVTASSWNTLRSDIETAMSASIANDGQTTCSARIPFAAGASAMLGAVTGVSYSFTGDVNTGLYSSTADKCGLVAGGTEIFRVESGLCSPVTNNTIDLGSSGAKFKDAYFAGAVTLATLTFSGTDPYPKKATTNTFTRGQTITGGSDEIQLLVTGKTSQTALTFVVEQQGGFNVLEVDTSNIATNFNCNMVQVGNLDVVQLKLKGHATQTSDIFLIEKSDGTDLFKVDNSGNITALGNLTLTGTLAIGGMPAGTLLQSVSNTYATNEALATTIPLDDTIPQNTEGTEIVTQAITPKHANNILEFEFSGFVSGAGTTVCIAALFQDTTADALAVGVATAGSATDPNTITLRYRMTAGTTSATTFKIRVGAETGTIRMNGSTSARYFGGIAAARLTIREYKA